MIISDAQKAIIARTLTIQRMVKEGASPDTIHVEVSALDKDVSALHAAQYRTPVPEIERKRLIEALESGIDYKLTDKNEHTIFSVNHERIPQNYYAILLWRVDWCYTAIEKATVLGCFDRLMAYEYPDSPADPYRSRYIPKTFEPWE